MAVIPQFSICVSDNCETLTFKETTGAYEATNNPNGWGAPNRTTAMATAATLVITDPSGTVYTLNLYATGDFPTTDNTIEYEVDPTDIGLAVGDKLTDGIYKFVYNVTTLSGTTVIYSQTKYEAFYCTVQCCVMSLFKNIDIDCDCSTTAIDKATKGLVLLKGLTSASGCGNITEFNIILAQLQKLCLNSNCLTCK